MLTLSNEMYIVDVVGRQFMEPEQLMVLNLSEVIIVLRLLSMEVILLVLITQE